jgi:hypothetical protein
MTEYVKTKCYECTGEYDDAGYGLFMCIQGTVYGPCEYPTCGGVCEAVGSCSCTCHD